MAVSSFLKSAVMKFGPDVGENPFVECVHGCTKNSYHPGKESEHSSSRERARFTPAGQTGKSEMVTRKAGSSDFERSHREQQATAKQIWIRFVGKTKPIEMRPGKTEGLERSERRWSWEKTPTFL